MIFDISIHASRGGSDSLIATHWQAAQGFQSTLPAGEATLRLEGPGGLLRDFNPRFPRGKRPTAGARYTPSSGFQSTLPAGEATPMLWKGRQNLSFQSTLPAGEATWIRALVPYPSLISIHASRGGSDILVGELAKILRDFNPRFPRGKRPQNFAEPRVIAHISIHASRGGSDLHPLADVVAAVEFQSTLPAGEATGASMPSTMRWKDFNPRFPRGKRRQDWSHHSHLRGFQSTLPAGEATATTQI